MDKYSKHQPTMKVLWGVDAKFCMGCQGVKLVVTHNILRVNGNPKQTG